VPAAARTVGGPEVRRGAWGTLASGGELDDPWAAPEDELYPTVADPTDAAALPEEFELEFAQGLPVAAFGSALDGPGLVRQVEKVARRHGVGRGVHLGEAALGLVTRQAFEAPAAAVLLRAHRELEKLVLTRRQLELLALLGARYGELFQRGLYHEPALRDVERFAASSQRTVTGTVRVRLSRGVVDVLGVRSPAGLAGPEAWAHGEGAVVVDPRDARGHARVLSIPGRLARRRDERAAAEGGAPEEE
jgi:argininosuccinate synthase